MWVGQQLADGLDFWGFLGSLILGGIILGIYTGLLGYVGAKTGLSLDLLSQRAFGEKGSYLPSAMTSFTPIGWFGVGSFVSGGTATPNFARFAKNGKSGAITTVVAFFIGNSLMFFFGAVYDTPHGVACAMMLPIVMEYNQECTGEKYREIARAMGVAGVDEMSQEEYRKAAIDAVKKLSADVGIPSVLEAVKEEDLQFLADSAHADACAPGNPKDASVEDLKDLFRKIMA